MAYQAHQWFPGDQITAERLNALEDGVARTGTGDGSGTNGADGGYYIPSVDSACNLSWAATKEEMAPVPSVNISPKSITDAQIDAICV